MKNVYIESSVPVQVKQEVKEDIQEKEIKHTYDPLYHNYAPTLLQFHVSLDQDGSFVMEIPYSNRLKPVESKYAIVCRYDSVDDVWKEVKFENLKDSKRFKVIGDQSGIYGVFKNKYWYATFTQNIANEYPRWTRIRKSKESIGQQFLNFFGMEIEEISDWLEWILNQKFITTADTSVLDWIYMYPLNNIEQSNDVMLFNQTNGKTEVVPILETVDEFFFNDRNEGGIIDYDENKFYSVVKYENLRGVVQTEDDMFELDAEPIPFHIWNAFDEFGLLLHVKRLHLEKNADFKERILDVFRYPANSSKSGLKHGIARELNLIKRTKETTWENDFKEFIIYNKSGLPIDIDSLRVDYQPLESDQYECINEQHIKIYPLQKGREHVVSFIYGIETYELHDKTDEELHQLMFKENGQATEKLISWVSYINTVAPIMWDRFKWDEGYWDTVSKELAGIGYIPNMWDTDISVWKTYKLQVNRWEDKHIWK